MADHIITRGDRAEALLKNIDFIELWEMVVDESAREVFKTPISDSKTRDEIVLTVHGGRYYINKLIEYRNLRDAEILRRSQKEQELAELIEFEDESNNFPI